MTIVRSPAVEVLLAQLVDYAGLFPPAKLDMNATVRNYASYAAGDDAWMLGRLVVPVSRLDEMEQSAAGLMPVDLDDEPWHVSALTAPAGDGAVEGDLERIAEFNAAHAQPDAGLARIDVIELRAAAVAEVESVLDLVSDELFPFFEMPIDRDPRGLLAALVGSDAGAKTRTGGPKAQDYPDPADLARFIAAAAEARVPFKATAGLHHPLRHPSAAVGTMEFGFLNVFVAGVLATQGDPEPDLIEQVLTDERIDSFRFDEDGGSWREHRFSVTQIAQARQRFAISYGSCSFDEPREDLRALGLL